MVGETQVSYGRSLLLQEHFCAFYDSTEKAVLGLEDPKRKLGGPHELFRFKLTRKVPHIAIYFIPF